MTVSPPSSRIDTGSLRTTTVVPASIPSEADVLPPPEHAASATQSAPATAAPAIATCLPASGLRVNDAPLRRSVGPAVSTGVRRPPKLDNGPTYGTAHLWGKQGRLIGQNRGGAP